MHILITGGFGQVGLAIINELLERSHKIRIFELKNKKTKKQAKKFGNEIEVYWGNLLDSKSIKSALESVDVVIHLAGIIPPLSESNVELCQNVNVNGIKKLVQEIEHSSKKPPLIFASSASVMGPTQDQNPPISAYDPLNPTTNYTRSKVEAEKIIAESDLTYCICRFGAVLTTNTRGDFQILKEGFEMPLDNRVEMVLDLDLAVAMANAAEFIVKEKGKEIDGKILNIGGGKDFQRYGRNLTQDLFEIMGIGKLDEDCYSKEDYLIDWLDTEESQELLQYQQHSFEEAMKIFLKPYKKLKPLIRLFSPFIRKMLEKQSPYNKS